MKHTYVTRSCNALLLMIFIFVQMPISGVCFDTTPSHLAPQSFTRLDSEQARFWEQVLGDVISRGLNLPDPQAEDLAKEIWNETVGMLRSQGFRDKKIFYLLKDLIEGFRPAKTDDGIALLVSRVETKGYTVPRYTLTIGYDRAKSLRPAWQIHPSLSDGREECVYPFSLFLREEGMDRAEFILSCLNFFFALSLEQARAFTEPQLEALENAMRWGFFVGEPIAKVLENDSRLKAEGVKFYRRPENPEVLFLGNAQKPEKEYAFLGYPRLTTESVLDLWKIPAMHRKNSLEGPRGKTDFGIVKKILQEKVFPLFPAADRTVWVNILNAPQFEQLFNGEKLQASFVLDASDKTIRQLKEIILTINAITGLKIVTSDMLDGSLQHVGPENLKMEIINPDALQCLGTVRDWNTLRFVLKGARNQRLPLEAMNQAFLNIREGSNKAMWGTEPYRIFIPTYTDRGGKEVARQVPALIENAQLFGHKIHLVVLDDRQQPDENVRRQILYYANGKRNVTIEYLDMKDKEAILQALMPDLAKNKLFGEKASRTFMDLEVFAPGSGAGNRNFATLYALLTAKDPMKGQAVILMDHDAMPKASISYGKFPDVNRIEIPVNFLPAMVEPFWKNPSTVLTFSLCVGVPDKLALRQESASYVSLKIEPPSFNTIPTTPDQLVEGDVLAYAATTASGLVADEEFLPSFGIARVDDAFMSPFTGSLRWKDIPNYFRQTSPTELVETALINDLQKETRNYETNFRKEIFRAILPLIMIYIDRAIGKLASTVNNYETRYWALVHGLKQLQLDLDNPNSMDLSSQEGILGVFAGPGGEMSFRRLIWRFFQTSIPRENKAMREKFRWILDVPPDDPWITSDESHQEMIRDMQDKLQFMIKVLDQWAIMQEAVAHLRESTPGRSAGEGTIRYVETAL